MTVRGHDELSPLLFGGARQLVNIKLCPGDGAVNPADLRGQVALAIDQSLTVVGVEGFDESDLPETQVADWVAAI